MQTVMIVEDDVMISDILVEMLTDSGYKVCGTARTVDKAVKSANELHPDLIILDLMLAKGGFGNEVAARMDRSYKPGILYATGNKSHYLLTNADGHACIAKPYRAADMLRSLEIITEILDTGLVSTIFPRGFSLLEESTHNF